MDTDYDDWCLRCNREHENAHATGREQPRPCDLHTKAPGEACTPCKETAEVEGGPLNCQCKPSSRDEDSLKNTTSPAPAQQQPVALSGQDFGEELGAQPLQDPAPQNLLQWLGEYSAQSQEVQADLKLVLRKLRGLEESVADLRRELNLIGERQRSLSTTSSSSDSSSLDSSESSSSDPSSSESDHKSKGKKKRGQDNKHKKRRTAGPDGLAFLKDMFNKRDQQKQAKRCPDGLAFLKDMSNKRDQQKLKAAEQDFKKLKGKEVQKQRQKAKAKNKSTYKAPPFLKEMQKRDLASRITTDEPPKPKKPARPNWKKREAKRQRKAAGTGAEAGGGDDADAGAEAEPDAEDTTAEQPEVEQTEEAADKEMADAGEDDEHESRSQASSESSAYEEPWAGINLNIEDEAAEADALVAWTKNQEERVKKEAKAKRRRGGRGGVEEE